MKCKNCGFVNADGVTHCRRCNTMLRTKEQSISSGGKKALLQILLLVAVTVGAVVIIWEILHHLLHAV